MAHDEWQRNDFMQVAIFSDDYYLFYGMSQLLMPFEGIEVINLYSPGGGRGHAVYCHADMVIVSFSSICRIMNFLSHIIDRPDHAIVLTGVETPRLSNFNCLKKASGWSRSLRQSRRMLQAAKGSVCRQERFRYWPCCWRVNPILVLPKH